MRVIAATPFLVVGFLSLIVALAIGGESVVDVLGRAWEETWAEMDREHKQQHK